MRVTAATSGRAGSGAEVTLSASRALDVSIRDTGWHVLDGGFRGSMPTSARYRLTAAGTCP